NVNAAMPDEGESATLTFQGLGAHAAFYAGSTLLPGPYDYDAVSDTYTLTGLTAGQVDTLGFKQAAGIASGTVTVTAKTIDGTEESALKTETFEVDSSAQLATSGDNTWLYGGAAAPMLDGRGGDDTIQLRYGE